MLLTPGISTGYWKAMKTPSQARSSGSSRAGPRRRARSTLGDLVVLAPGEHVGQRALARAVGAHDGVDLAGADLEVEAA